MAEAKGVGTFTWNELATTNTATCKAFYTRLFDWTSTDAPVGPVTYTVFWRDGQEVAGMLQMDEKWGGVRSHWMPYVAVADVDASAKRAAELGGQVCVPPTDVPNVGRFAVITDPSGAVFSLLTMKR